MSEPSYVTRGRSRGYKAISSALSPWRSFFSGTLFSDNWHRCTGEQTHLQDKGHLSNLSFTLPDVLNYVHSTQVTKCSAPRPSLHSECLDVALPCVPIRLGGWPLSANVKEAAGHSLSEATEKRQSRNLEDTRSGGLPLWGRSRTLGVCDRKCAHSNVLLLHVPSISSVHKSRGDPVLASLTYVLLNFRCHVSFSLFILLQSRERGDFLNQSKGSNMVQDTNGVTERDTDLVTSTQLQELGHCQPTSVEIWEHYTVILCWSRTKSYVRRGCKSSNYGQLDWYLVLNTHVHTHTHTHTQIDLKSIWIYWHKHYSLKLFHRSRCRCRFISMPKQEVKDIWDIMWTKSSRPLLCLITLSLIWLSLPLSVWLAQRCNMRNSLPVGLFFTSSQPLFGLMWLSFNQSEVSKMRQRGRETKKKPKVMKLRARGWEEAKMRLKGMRPRKFGKFILSLW